MSAFAQDDNGEIHLISAVDSERTLCGNVIEGELGSGVPYGTTKGNGAWREVNRTAVTCELCLIEIGNCKSVRIPRE